MFCTVGLNFETGQREREGSSKSISFLSFFLKQKFVNVLCIRLHILPKVYHIHCGKIQSNHKYAII